MQRRGLGKQQPLRRNAVQERFRTSRSIVMDALQAFLEELKRQKIAVGHLLGLFHILVGRKIARQDGSPVSGGMTWRELAAALKKARWPKEAVRELNLEPEELAPRDREKFW